MRDKSRTGSTGPKDGLCDLHVHTTCSDGILSPETMVRKAKEVRLAAVAIADHDSVDGVDPAVSTGKLVGIEVVPAVEMSCMYQKVDVHVLGYYMDYHNPELLGYLEKVREKRRERAERIVAKLNEQGLELDVKRVMEIADGGALGRPHIAQALLERGHVKTMDEAFNRFIGYHSPAYAPKMEISPLEATSLIRKYGGIPVAAHPGSYRDDKLLNDLIAAGLMGIEVYHPDHDAVLSEHYLEIAQKNNLFITGGSDCHGGRKGKLYIGETNVPYRYLEQMKKFKGLA